MADVEVVPKIRCDNCGFTTEKNASDAGASRSYQRPHRWGSLTIASGRGQQGYPVETLRFVDLCPRCATCAHDAAAAILKELRAE